MSLFTVYAILQPSPDIKKALQRLADNSERVATTLEAIKAKLDEAATQSPEDLASVTAELKSHADAAAGVLPAVPPSTPGA